MEAVDTNRLPEFLSSTEDFRVVVYTWGFNHRADSELIQNSWKPVRLVFSSNATMEESNVISSVQSSFLETLTEVCKALVGPS
jgi:hypothetical protein